MTLSMITIVAPLDPSALPTAQAAIDVMGNPADASIAQRIDATNSELGIHFASLHALPSFTPGRAHLILEFTADGDESRALKQLVDAIGLELATVFALASDWHSDDILPYLTRHKIKIGFGLGDNPGLHHVGSPGKTVGRIQEEAALAERCSQILAAQVGGGESRLLPKALDRLLDVRETLGNECPDITVAQGRVEFEPATVPALITGTLAAFVRVYLWPLVLLLTAWIGFQAALAWTSAMGAPGWHVALTVGHGLLRGLVTGLPLALLLVGLGGWLIYSRLLWLEAHDWTSKEAPDRAQLYEIVERENHGALNHMVSLTERKPGWVRYFTQRLGFFIVATLGGMLYRPGYLALVGTIHFARWVTVPGTRDLLFMSNYGGSWEAYLEDFITLAHEGLTAVWSNTVGFPPSQNLIGLGATDGERFKRFARNSMHPSRFWYAAYPDLTTDMIRANSGIRRGLSGAMTEDEAVSWLTYFGSALRPVDRVASTDVQSILFGGLGFLPYSTLTLWRLPKTVAESRAWLADLSPLIAYNDGRRVRDDDQLNAIVQVAMSSRGLRALGLPEDGLESFSPAFLEDMLDPQRQRILGDVGDCASEHWWWGRDPAHVAVIIYGQTQGSFDALIKTISDLAARYGLEPIETIGMQPFDPPTNREPFGFRDGISQPVIRGTHKGMKHNDPMHLVEPGEFILGYPDNRGSMPPVPSMEAIWDPENELPVIGSSGEFARNSVNNMRDIGGNGSYLVIRQLEQDPDAFNAFCEAEASRLKPVLHAPYKVTPEFIAAKMVGRWRDGTPLVRSPYMPPRSEETVPSGTTSSPPTVPTHPDQNQFQLGAEDPGGIRCPVGAHIRRANPRDSLNPGSDEQVAISNRHRIMRIGRKYQPKTGQKPGLLFMCLAGDIERQFEFIQQTWIGGNVISLSRPITLRGERDPILGSGAPGTNSFSIPTPEGQIKLGPLQRFVTMRGGGYFFLPGRRLIRYLSGGLPAATKAAATRATQDLVPAPARTRKSPRRKTLEKTRPLA